MKNLSRLELSEEKSKLKNNDYIIFRYRNEKNKSKKIVLANKKSKKKGKKNKTKRHRGIKSFLNIF
jgi:hypothetical protein